jgi:hypothetical protein
MLASEGTDERCYSHANGRVSISIMVVRRDGRCREVEIIERLAGSDIKVTQIEGK